MLRSLLLVCALAAAAADIATASGVAVTNGKIAYISGARDAEGVRLINPDGSGSQLVVRPPTAPCPNPRGCLMSDLSWSPDGRKLTFSREDATASSSIVSLFTTDADGTDEHRLCDNCGEPAWSPDGRRLVVAAKSVLYTVGANGEDLHRLTRRDDYSEGEADGSPAWSPDGSRILFSRGSLYTVRPNGFGLRRIRGTAGATAAAWLPDGHSIIFSVAGDKVFTVGSDGSRLALLLTTSGPDDLDGAKWSPDGTRVVYAVDRRLGGDEGGFAEDVWVMRADGTGRLRVFHENCCIGYSATPIWSPDGKQIAIAAGPGVFVVNADGSGFHRLRGLVKSAWGYPSLAWQALR